jgi:malate dehydrogenase (oxaloacetate-decarboxylating)(NADP+)
LITNEQNRTQRIVFAEADHLDIESGSNCIWRGYLHPILLGSKEIILELKEELAFVIWDYWSKK